jgi:gamma-glutamylcyclotransferase (GGCT)/AIG2-like uncharacterized protein YtfP
MPTYFAYGSNMSDEQIRERCPGHRFVCVARLPDHRLAFTRWSARRAGGVADIVAAPGSSVWGVVFEMTESDMVALDGHEGVHAHPPAYRRRNVVVLAGEGGATPLDAITYEVCEKSPEDHAPHAAYLGLIRAGARKWNLPQGYQEQLAAVRSVA